jgi:uncharacterized membrane protein YjjP (DUF1212 family)
VVDGEIGFVLALARALHRFGTPAHRLEDALTNVCRSLGLDAEVFTTPTAIILSFGRPHELRTRLMRVEGGELDMGKLAQIDEVGDQVIAHEINADEASARLEQILAAPKQFSRPLYTLSHGVTAAALAVFFGGTLPDVMLAGGIGLILGLLAQLIARSTDQTRVFELIGSAFAAFTAGVASHYSHAISPSLVTLAALVILLPGMSLTVAMTELATRNLIAGTARLMSALIVLLELVVGVALGDRIARSLVTVSTGLPGVLPEYANWIALVASALGVAVLVQARPRAFGWIISACAVGYAGSRYGTALLGPELGVLVGAFALGVLSNTYARWLGRPAQVVSVPAVLLLVPGSMGLRGMTSLLDQQTLTGIETVFAMFIVAIAIVAGLLIANAVVQPRRSL